MVIQIKTNGNGFVLINQIENLQETMSNHNLAEQALSLRVTEEMLQRAEDAKESGYGSRAKYARQMWLAGESVVGDLDPRVGNSAADHNSEISSAEAAAKALDDGALLTELSDDPQSYDEIVSSLTQDFEDVLTNRLLELANDDRSSVEADGKGNYVLEE